MVEAAVEMDDDAMGAYLDGQEPDVDTLKRLIRKATVTSKFYPMLCGSAFKNKGVQPLLDAVVDYLPSPADREAFKAIDVKTGAGDGAQAARHRAAVDAGVQDHGRPARRRHHLLPRLLGQGRERHGGHQHHPRQEGAGRAHVPDACRRPRADQRGLRRRHHRAGRPQGHPHRRDAVRPAAAGAAREDGVPQPRHRAGHRAEGQGRPGEDGHRAAEAGRPRIPRSASRPTPRAARPSSRAWASCIWRSRSTS